ncbi:MAG: DUF2493 domain-containing protein [Ruminococcaceae bacterium]|nr:DUF2493 domain-containing protein [Oscillospiraceae bacterium]
MLFGKKKEMHKIVIGGCRDFDDYEFFKVKVDAYLETVRDKDITILSGHCSGVDQMAERYAKERHLKLLIFPAEWNLYGRSAGPIRNEKMVQQAETVIAFWNGKSRGTKSLIHLATQYGRNLEVVPIQ